MHPWPGFRLRVQPEREWGRSGPASPLSSTKEFQTLALDHRNCFVDIVFEKVLDCMCLSCVHMWLLSHMWYSHVATQPHMVMHPHIVIQPHVVMCPQVVIQPWSTASNLSPTLPNTALIRTAPWPDVCSCQSGNK